MFCVSCLSLAEVLCHFLIKSVQLFTLELKLSKRLQGAVSSLSFFLILWLMLSCILLKQSNMVLTVESTGLQTAS